MWLGALWSAESNSWGRRYNCVYIHLTWWVSLIFLLTETINEGYGWHSHIWIESLDCVPIWLTMSKLMSLGKDDDEVHIALTDVIWPFSLYTCVLKKELWNWDRVRKKPFLFCLQTFNWSCDCGKEPDVMQLCSAVRILYLFTIFGIWFRKDIIVLN